MILPESHPAVTIPLEMRFWDASQSSKIQVFQCDTLLCKSRCQVLYRALHSDNGEKIPLFAGFFAPAESSRVASSNMNLTSESRKPSIWWWTATSRHSNDCRKGLRWGKYGSQNGVPESSSNAPRILTTPNYRESGPLDPGSCPCAAAFTVDKTPSEGEYRPLDDHIGDLTSHDVSLMPHP